MRVLALSVVVAMQLAIPAAAPQSTAVVQSPNLTIDADAAIITILVRPDRMESFERVLGRLKASLAASKNPARRKQAAGWTVFRASELVQGQVSYVMRIEPVVRGEEYDILRLISEVYPKETLELFQAYRDALSARTLMTLGRVEIEGLGRADAVNEPAAPPSATPSIAGPPVTPLLSFEDAQIVLVTALVRPERAADFEAVLAQVGRALQASSRPGRKRQAAGWKVYRAREGIDGNVPYVMSFDPVILRAEYDPIRLIQEVYPAAVQDVFSRYRAAFVGQAIVRLGNRMDMAQ